MFGSPCCEHWEDYVWSVIKFVRIQFWVFCVLESWVPLAKTIRLTARNMHVDAFRNEFQLLKYCKQEDLSQITALQDLHTSVYKKYFFCRYVLFPVLNFLAGVIASVLNCWAGFYPEITRGCKSGRGRSNRKGREWGWGFLGTGTASPTPHQLVGLGSTVSSPSEVLCRALENMKFGATWDLKSHYRNAL